MTTKHEHNLAFYRDAWRSVPLMKAQHWPDHRAIEPWLTGDVLEVGPGMFPRCDHARYLEPEPHTAERLRALGKECTVARLERAPFADDSFDTILAFDVLEHCDDDALALAEVKRMLRPTGVFVVSVPLHQRYWSKLDEISGHTFRYDPVVLVRKLTSAGLVIRHAHVYRPPSANIKRWGDRALLTAISRLGAERAMSAKAWFVRTFSATQPSIELVEWPTSVPTDANAILLVCGASKAGL